MGMYDEITIKKALPLPKELKKLPIQWKEHKFQTKNLENCLLEYFIDNKGNLYEIDIEREYIPYSEEEKKNKQSPWDLYKEVKEISRHNKKVDFHGKLCFYDYLNFDEQQDCWLEFEAYFIYGKLDKIELKEFRLEPSHSLRLEEFKKELNAKQKTLKYKVLNFIRAIKGDKVLYFVAKICYKLSNFFSSIQWKIYKIANF